MKYIDDISEQPWSSIDFRKYKLYLELRKERDKFLKSLKKQRHCDWAIGKKLIEAGGLGDTVYILPARGGSRFPYEAIERYREEGRTVKLIRPGESTDCRTNIEKIKELCIDWDLYRNPEYEEIDKYIHEQIMQRFREDIVKDWIRDKQWITTAWPDTYIYSPKTYTDWAVRDFLLNPTYGIVYKKDDTYYGGVTCP